MSVGCGDSADILHGSDSILPWTHTNGHLSKAAYYKAIFKENSHNCVYKQIIRVKCPNKCMPGVHSAWVVIVYLWLPVRMLVF